jgi:DNA replication protein DnaC
MNKCEFCGKPKIKAGLPINLKEKFNYDIFADIWVYDCNCIKIKAEKEQKQKEDELRRRKQQELFSTAQLPKRYESNTFKNIKKNENVLKAMEYCKNFKPNTDYCISLIGDIGRGKTVILDCICKELMTQGYTVLFTDFSSLLDKIQATYAKNAKETELDIYKWLFSFDFIAFDDLGREKYTDKRLEQAFKIFNTLYNEIKNFGFSSNPEMLEKLRKIEDFEAIIDRIRQCCKYKLEFEGDSLR